MVVGPQVMVRCACQRLKKEWACHQVQVAEQQRATRGGAASWQRTGGTSGLLPCDEECVRLEEGRRRVEERGRAEEKERAEREAEEGRQVR